MYIELACSSCGTSFPVSYAQLYKLWKQGYEELTPENRKIASASTTVRCRCGNVDDYKSPMLKYVFQLIFDEFVREEEMV